MQVRFGRRILNALACLSLLFIGAGTAWSGEDPLESQNTTADGAQEYSAFNGDYWLEYVDDAGKLLISPVRWDEGDWINAAAVAAVTGSFFLLDDNIQDFWQDDLRGDFTDGTADIFQAFGDTKFILPGLPILFVSGGFVRYGFGDVEEGARLQETALLSLESYILAAGLTEGLKNLVGRKRPNQTPDKNDFEGPGGEKSFPSGHSTHAWAIASVVASEYEHSFAIRATAYSFATLTSLARINENKHWASDVFFGAALGYFIGKFVYEENPFRNNDNILFLPTVSQDKVALQLTYRF